MKHPTKSTVALFFAALPWLCSGCRNEPPQDDSEQTSATVPVVVRCAPATVTTLRPSIELVGTLVGVPERAALLSTQVAGQVASVRVVEGQSIRAGDELLQLDGRFAEVQCAKARAAVEEMQAIVTRLKRGSRAEDVEAARQELRKSETNLRLMRAKVESATALQESQAIPELEFAKRKTAAEDAEADVAVNRAKLEILEAGPRSELIAEAEAKLAGAKADLAAAELALQLTHISAPFDGVVTEVPVRQGMFVSEGTTLLTLVDLSTLFAQTRIPTAYLSKVQAGQNVDVHVESFPDEVFTGAVARISRQADLQTGDVDAYASVPNANSELRPGLACRVKIWLPEIERATAVPVAAIADRDGTPVVTVVREKKAHETEVRLGAITDDLVQILDGVADGDLVAVEGGYGLPDGCPCTVVLDNSPVASTRDAQDTP